MNQYVKKNRDFTRYFYRGATELNLDSTGRLLLPKRLLEYAGVDKEVVLFAHGNKIELWDKTAYDDLLSDEPDEFGFLAEEVMGNVANNGEDGVS